LKLLWQWLFQESRQPTEAGGMVVVVVVVVVVVGRVVAERE
jgi:hypothetical protein